MIASFIIVLVLLTLSGALAWIRKRKTPEDYLVASRNVPPWLAALSTVATNNSGFMFIGMIGYTYRFGVSSIWLMVGLIATKSPALTMNTALIFATAVSSGPKMNSTASESMSSKKKKASLK